MPLPTWLRCPACDSGSVSIEELVEPDVLLECRVCGTREAFAVPPRSFSPEQGVS